MRLLMCVHYECGGVWKIVSFPGHPPPLPSSYIRERGGGLGMRLQWVSEEGWGSGSEQLYKLCLSQLPGMYTADDLLHVIALHCKVLTTFLSSGSTSLAKRCWSLDLVKRTIRTPMLVILVRGLAFSEKEAHMLTFLPNYQSSQWADTLSSFWWECWWSY